MGLKEMTRAILFAILFFAISVKGDDCPSQCKCTGVKVDCKNKGLTAIPSKFPSTTRQIDLSENQITEVGDNAFASASKVTYIDLRHNSISKIGGLAFGGINELKTLYLIKNNLGDDVDLTSLTDKANLQNLYLSFNLFTKIPPIQSTYLRRLVLDGNQISSAQLPKSYQTCLNLQSLVLSHNNIGTIASTDFANLKSSIKSLDLKLNSISDIDPSAFSPIGRSLETLNLDNNGLDETIVKAALFGLSQGGKPALLTLSLNNNRITKIDNQIFASLKEGRVRNLQLDNNLIASIDPTGLSNVVDSLELLSLRKCGFSTIGFDLSKLGKLQQLAIDGNHMVALPQFLPVTLVRMTASSNQITGWPGSTFTGLTALTFLDLSYNRLSVFDNAALNTSMGDALSSLKNLSLEHNPFNCTCDLKDFIKYAESKSITVKNWKTYTCFSPADRRGDLVSKFDVSNCSTKFLLKNTQDSRMMNHSPYNGRSVTVNIQQSLLALPELLYLLSGIMIIMIVYVVLKQVLKRKCCTKIHRYRPLDASLSDEMVCKNP